MNSIVVHYKELALKGRNRPWFIKVLVRNLKTALADLHVRVVAIDDGPHRDRAGPATRRGREARGADQRASSASPTSRTPAAGPTISTRWPRPSSPTSATVQAGVVPRVGDARGQAAAVHLPAGRARSRRAHQGSRRLACRSRRSRADHSHRDDAGRRVLFLRQGAGRRRAADRDRRARRMPAVGRHRFAGGRVPDDAARLLGAAHSFSQLPDPVARVAGKSPRDRRAADDASAAVATGARARSANCSSRSCSRFRRSCAS